MRIPRLLVTIWLVAVTAACQSVREDRENWLTRVSLVALLAHPSDYDNRHIETMGFLAHEGEPAIHLTREHARAFDIASGVLLTVPDGSLKSLRNSGCFDKYVDVLGRFVVIHEYIGKDIRVRTIRDAFTKKVCWRAK